MNVKLEDRKEDTNCLKLALYLAGIEIDYEDVDLILKVQERLKKKKGSFSVRDGMQVRREWENRWKEYFNDLAKELKSKQSEK